MRVRRLRCVLWAVLTLWLAVPGAASWADSPIAAIVTFDHAELQAPARPGLPVVLRLSATIAPGWHINSDRPLSPYYIPTHLSVTPPAPVRAAGVTYPDAQVIVPGFSSGERMAVFTGTAVFTAALAAGGAPPAPGEYQIALDYQACNNLQCLRPVTIRRSFRLAWPVAGAASPAPQVPAPAPSAGAAGVFRSYGMIWSFLLIFLGGIALNLTPCVYPLIGVTIAYFGNQGGGGTRRVLILALLYVAGIAATFSAVGTAAALSGGLFGALLENPVVLGVIAGMLLMLAASSFGWFSLQPPAWMMQKVGIARPGFLGALAMGLGMGVVAAPCIGPFVLGLLLLVEQSRSALFGLAVFFVLAAGMGLPYVALALAAGSIRALPRSGQWLAWVEHLFGFILIGLALYFVAPVFPGRAVSRMLPFYAAAVGIYMGLLSPVGRGLRWFLIIRTAVGLGSAAALVYMLLPAAPRQEVRFAKFDRGGLAAAMGRRQPVIIDFSADWCVPCREMEATTFTNPAVVREARRFAAMRADLTRSDGATGALIDQYGIQGVPTVLLVGSTGKVEKRMVGYVGVREFLDSLKAIN